MSETGNTVDAAIAAPLPVRNCDPASYILGSVGRAANEFFEWFGSLGNFSWRVIRAAVTPPYEGRELIRQLDEVGSKSFPLVALAGAAIGVVISMEARYSLTRFGAKSMFPSTLVYSVIQVMGPIMTGLIVCGRVSEQLNLILATRDSARGLIVSMSDVLFDTGQYSLKPGAREKLAKVAGILIAYPGLNIAVGGYTDNVGGDAMNQTLSENRAGAVRDYLVAQGVTTGNLSAKGYGNTAPVSSNDTSSGRQENRRVELVVSGDAIGSPTNAQTGSLQ
jgi:flagellar motor protein MotB